MTKRIVFLDLEGTLIDVPRVIDSPIPKSMWQSLARLLGQECLREEELSHRRWSNGDIPNYVAWMDETIRMFLRHGLKRTHIEELKALVRMTPGVLEFAARMHEHNAVLVIVTGALKSVAEPLFVSMKAQHLFSGCELFFDSSGEVLHWNLLPSDWYGKTDFMELLIREYRLGRESCVFIGDGANDVELAKRVGFSIGFNADEALEAVVSASVKQPTQHMDFSKLVPVIEGFWDRMKQ
jgi:HAD superfamily phosphoserine phosphatase-like hydrolase